MARASAMAPGTVAAAVLDRLAAGLRPGCVELLENFEADSE
jgi:hypothetical protein